VLSQLLSGLAQRCIWPRWTRFQNRESDYISNQLFRSIELTSYKLSILCWKR